MLQYLAGKVSRLPASISLVLLFLLVLTIPFTLFVAKTSQEVRQRAQTVAPTTVQITDQGFSPPNITIHAGTTVEWVNKSPATNHTAATRFPDASAEHWDTGSLAPGQKGSHTFTIPGTYDVHCALHPSSEVGVITVTGDTPSPTPTPPVEPTQVAPTMNCLGSCPITPTIPIPSATLIPSSVLSPSTALTVAPTLTLIPVTPGASSSAIAPPPIATGSALPTVPAPQQNGFMAFLLALFFLFIKFLFGLF